MTSRDANILNIDFGFIACASFHPTHSCKQTFSPILGQVNLLVEKFEALKTGFLLDAKNIVNFEEIPPDLIINWDQAGINYVPVGSWTMEKEGTRREELAGKDCKRQLTAVFGGSMAGHLLPIQLIYQGKTQQCVPIVKFPADWDITFSENHWSNEGTITDYLEKVLIPYIGRKRQERSRYTALVR